MRQKPVARAEAVCVRCSLKISPAIMNLKPAAIELDGSPIWDILTGQCSKGDINRRHSNGVKCKSGRRFWQSDPHSLRQLQRSVTAQAMGAWGQISNLGSEIAWRPRHRAHR